MILISKASRVFIIYDQLILPGANAIADNVAKLLTQHPMFKEHCGKTASDSERFFEIADVDVPVSKAVTDMVDISDRLAESILAMKPADAIKIVKETLDIRAILRLRERESRSEVCSAIMAQYAFLTKDDKPKEKVD
jgi:hypothetical protein